MERLITLREALQIADDSWGEAALFLTLDIEWNLQTICAILEVDRFDDGEHPPRFARQHALSRVLSMDQIQDIVSNAQQQIDEPNVEQLFSAFLFYVHRDAFINFGKP